MTATQRNELREQRVRTRRAAKRLDSALAYDGDVATSALAFLASVRGYRRIAQLTIQPRANGIVQRSL